MKKSVILYTLLLCLLLTACNKEIIEDFSQVNDTDIDNCIYMLNEYLRDAFNVEYYDTPEQEKQAIFKDEYNVNNPDKLIGISEEIPAGYYADQLARSYYPVYNFDSFDSLLEHFNNYFTANAMIKIKAYLEQGLSDIDGTLYLVRGGRGYGTVSLDFDTVDKSQFSNDGIVSVDSLLFGEKDREYNVKFTYEDGILKIDSFE